MRKTRRSKRLAACSILLFLGAYTAGAWPRISRYNYANGWLSAVPTPVLIATIPLISEEPGSNANYNGQANSLSLSQRPLLDRIAHQIKGRLYQEKDTSRLDHWLFATLAQRESSQVLTDQSALRGDMYSYVYNAWARQNRMTNNEERWARSVHDLQIEHSKYIQDEWFAYARIRVRRLLADHQWRVQIDKMLYECVRKSDWDSWDGFYDLRPVGKERSDWWDFNQRIYSNLFTYSNFSSPGTQVTHEVRGRIFEGDEHIDLWWPVADIEELVPFASTRAVKSAIEFGTTGWHEPVESIPGYELIEEAEPYNQWISSHIQVQISHTDRNAWYTQPSNKPGIMPNRFRLYLDREKGLGNTELEAFTFGGLISVVLEFAPGGRYEGPMPLKRAVPLHGEPAWWALRDEVDEHGVRVFANNSGYVPLHKPERHWPMNVALNDTLVNAYIEVRFGMTVLGDDGFRAIADSKAERFIVDAVRIPIDSHDYRLIENAIKARSGFIELGYIDLYESDEIDTLVEQYGAKSYSYMNRKKATRGFRVGL